jgi:hypothetical protein
VTDIGSKEISLDEAIEKKMFSVFGDREIFNLQLDSLKILLPKLKFKSKSERLAMQSEKCTDTANESVDYGNLPSLDVSDVPSEFKSLVDHFEDLRQKYAFGGQRQF